MLQLKAGAFILLLVIFHHSLMAGSQDSLALEHYKVQQLYDHAGHSPLQMAPLYGQFNDYFLDINPTLALSALQQYQQYWERKGMYKLAHESLWKQGMVLIQAGEMDRGKALVNQGVAQYLKLDLAERDFDRLLILVNWIYSHIEIYDYARELLFSMEPVILRKAPIRALDIKYHLGYIEYCVANYQESLEYFSSLLTRDAAPYTGNIKGGAYAYIGWNHRYLGDYDQSIHYFKKYQQYSRQNGDSTEVVDAGRFIANIYELQGKYELALNKYFKALDYYNQLGDEERIAWILNAIGSVFKQQGDLVAARQYFFEANALYEKLDLEYGIATCQRDLGQMYLAEGKIDSALHYLNAARSLREKDKSTGYAEVLRLCAEAYYLNGNTNQSLVLLVEAYYFAKKANKLREQNGAMVLLAEILFHLPQNRQASILAQIGYEDVESLLLSAQKISEAHSNAENKLNTLYLLSDYYKKTGQPARALGYFEQYSAFHDSVFNAKHMLAIQNMESIQNLKQKEQEIAMLEQEQKLQSLEIEKQKELKEKAQIKWLALLVLIIGLGYLIFLRYRLTQKRKEQQKRLEQEKREELARMKNRFFANMTHEFKTPLTLIEAPVSNLITKSQSNLDRQLLSIIKRNSQRLKRLSNQMLELSKIQEGEVKMHPTEFNLSALIRSVYYDFMPYAEDKGIDFQLDISEASVTTTLDWEKIEEVVFNLVSNAIKFTPRGNVVKVGLQTNDRGLSLVVADMGEGIPPEILKNIFNRFYTNENALKNNREGTGLGLSICYEYIQLHGGVIRVESQEGAGTTFTVDLPVDYRLEASKQPSEGSASSTPAEPLALTGKESGITLLLVEDNPDLRTFIANAVLPNYQIILATNGREGMQMAKDQQPDIIISDIMMPDMDGHEMLDGLKLDNRTDHIPFIFLTAKSLPKNRIRGLKQGADAYIEKPFEPDELRYCVRNMLQRQEQMRQKYQAALQQARPTSDEPLAESPFLRKVKAHVHDHLDDPQFNVIHLGQNLGLSRSQLHRKLKALTGMGPNQLIRSIRLNQAYQMLQEDELSISEIAYRTGFTSPSYFTKCFKETFQFAPSEVANPAS